MPTLQRNEFWTLLSLFGRFVKVVGPRVVGATRSLHEAINRLRIALHSQSGETWALVDSAVADDKRLAETQREQQHWHVIESLSVAVGAWIVGDADGFAETGTYAQTLIEALEGRSRAEKPLAPAEELVANVQQAFQGPTTPPPFVPRFSASLMPQGSQIPAPPVRPLAPGMSPNGHPTNASALLATATDAPATVAIGSAPEPTPEHAKLLAEMAAKRAEAEQAAKETPKS